MKASLRLYVSGQMRGVPNDNHPAFEAASKILHDMGHRVLTPHESPYETRAECLRHDIQLILVSDGVVVLDGWEASPGARFEVAEAWMLDLPVYRIEFTRNWCYELVPLERYTVTIPREDKYVKKVPLVGMMGYAKAGKDAFAKPLIEAGWTRVSLADPLKDIATAIGWDGSKEGDGRLLLQNLGMGVRDYLDPDAWVYKAEEAIEAAPGPVVITDVRFPNEIQMVRRRRGTLIRVERPGFGPVNAHISEHAASADDADVTFVNDGPLDELAVRVHTFIHQNLGVAV